MPEPENISPYMVGGSADIIEEDLEAGRLSWFIQATAV